RRGVDPPGQPGRDLLQQPGVAVRVLERGEGAVALPVRRPAAYPADPGARLELGARAPGVEHVADLGTALGELGTGRLYVGNDQVQPLGRARRGRGDPRAELDRAP